MGYKWGDEVVNLCGSLRSALESNEATAVLHESSTLPQFDVAIAAECLWRHDSHKILLQSLSDSVKPGGHAILSFSHHVPGVEHKDLEFFDLALQSGNAFFIIALVLMHISTVFFLNPYTI